MSLTALFLAPPLVVATLADVRFRIIPDLAVLAVAGIGLVAALSSGAPLPAVVTGFSALGLGLGLWWFGAWGMGDAKLLGAAGLVAGPDGMAPMIAVMAVAGALMAVVLLALAPHVRAGRVAVPAHAPRWVRAEARRLRMAPSLPYGLAIAAGLMAAVLLEG